MDLIFKDNNTLNNKELQLIYEQFARDKSVVVLYKCKLIEFLLSILDPNISYEKFFLQNNCIDYCNENEFKKYCTYKQEEKILTILQPFRKKFIQQYGVREVFVELRFQRSLYEFMVKRVVFPSWRLMSNKMVNYTPYVLYVYYQDSIFEQDIEKYNNDINIQFVDIETQFRIPFSLRYCGVLPGCGYNSVRFNPIVHCYESGELSEPMLLKLFIGRSNPSLFLSGIYDIPKWIKCYNYNDNSQHNELTISKYITDRICLRVDNEIYSYTDLQEKLSHIGVKLTKKKTDKPTL